MHLLNGTHVRFKAWVGEGQSLVVGIGKSLLEECDAVLWQADQEASSATDLFVLDQHSLKVDTLQSFHTSFEFNSTHTVFQSDRALDTNDPEDFVISMVSLLLCNFERIFLFR